MVSHLEERSASSMINIIRDQRSLASFERLAAAAIWCRNMTPLAESLSSAPSSHQPPHLAAGLPVCFVQLNYNN
jgi:hypothetical protein